MNSAVLACGASVPGLFQFCVHLEYKLIYHIVQYCRSNQLYNICYLLQYSVLDAYYISGANANRDLSCIKHVYTPMSSSMSEYPQIKEQAQQR